MSEEVKYISADDQDIRFYLPNVPILKYNELAKYKTIEKLLPKHKSHVILLYPVSSETSGHWIALTRFNDIIEFFDSYGGTVDDPFNWPTSNYKKNKRYLSNLLNRTKCKVVYNSIAFQSKKDALISTCGSYAVFRILSMIELDADLEQNNKLLKELKKSNPDMTYDDIIIQYIDKR